MHMERFPPRTAMLVKSFNAVSDVAVYDNAGVFPFLIWHMF